MSPSEPVTLLYGRSGRVTDRSVRRILFDCQSMLTFFGVYILLDMRCDVSEHRDESDRIRLIDTYCSRATVID